MDYSRMKERIRATVLESPSDMVINVHFPGPMARRAGCPKPGTTTNQDPTAEVYSHHMFPKP